jgi:hypothetical protein
MIASVEVGVPQAVMVVRNEVDSASWGFDLLGFHRGDFPSGSTAQTQGAINSAMVASLAGCGIAVHLIRRR